MSKDNFDFDFLNKNEYGNSEKKKFDLEDIIKETKKETKIELEKLNEAKKDVDEDEQRFINVIKSFEQKAHQEQEKKEIIEKEQPKINEFNIVTKKNKEKTFAPDASLFNDIKNGAVKTENVKPSPIKNMVKGVEEDESQRFDFTQASENEQIKEVDDYDEVANRDDIKSDLKATLRKVSLKKAINLFGLLIHVYLILSRFVSVVSISAIDINANPKAYLITTIALSTVLLLVNISTIFDGIKKMFFAKATPDGLAAVLGITSIGFDIYSICRPLYFNDHNMLTFDIFFSLILFLNISGKKQLFKNIIHNFDIISDDKLKNIVSKPMNDEVYNDIILETNQGSDIMFMEKTKFVSNYIKNANEDFKLDRASSKFAFAMFVICVMGAIGTVLYNKGFYQGILFFNAALAVSSPIFATLSFTMPVYKVNKALRQDGGVITSVKSAKKLETFATLVVNDEDLFKENDIVLSGIKVIGDGQIDKVIIYLSAMFNKIGGPLKSVFNDMIEDKNVVLPRVDDIVYHDRYGYSCLIESKSLIVGSLAHINSYGLKVNDEISDKAYKKSEKNVMYVAYNNSVVGAFVLAYNSNDDMLDAFDCLQDEMVTTAVVNHDYNLNDNILAKKFEIEDKSLIKTLSQHASSKCYNKFIPSDKKDAYLTSISGLKGIAYALEGCSKMLFSIKFNRIIKSFSSLVGLGLLGYIFFFTKPDAYLQLQILLFQIVWSIPQWFFSTINK